MSEHYCPVKGCGYGDEEGKTVSQVQGHINGSMGPEHDWDQLQEVVAAQSTEGHTPVTEEDDGTDTEGGEGATDTDTEDPDGGSTEDVDGYQAQKQMLEEGQIADADDTEGSEEDSTEGADPPKPKDSDDRDTDGDTEGGGGGGPSFTTLLGVGAAALGALLAAGSNDEPTADTDADEDVIDVEGGTVETETDDSEEGNPTPDTML